MNMSQMRTFSVAQQLVAMLVCLGASLAVAEDEAPEPLRDFKVEMIVFEYTNAPANSEDWTGPTPAESADIAAAPRPKKAALQYQSVPEEAYELGEITAKMRRSRDFRPLIHTAWTQPGYRKDEAPPLSLQRVARLPSRLNGRATLYLSRYLHLNVDLKLRARAGTAAANDANSFVQAVDTPVYSLLEQRRLRSGELHFFDHPQFGVLVKVSPVSTDDD